MALSSSSSSSSSCSVLFFLVTLLSISIFVFSQPPLNAGEQESVYKLLESINSDISWRSLFPDDLCFSAPHGIVCDYFTDDSSGSNSTAPDETPHITELSFGYVSDYSPNPPCTPTSSFDPTLLSSFSRLRKLFFYKCFAETAVSMPHFSSLLPSLEELVFIENPSLVGSLTGNISNLTSLRRLVLTGTNVSGELPDGFGDLLNLEQVTVSRNKLSGKIPLNLSKLKKLKVFDLSHNGFQGNVPDSAGELTELLKLDLSGNLFSGKIPDSLRKMERLEFLDLSENRFAKYGIPLFLGEMRSLKEVHLSGNLLGGQIPEIWENLGGIQGIGLSKMGLIGNIPASMGQFLKKVNYIGLDSNKLEGTVPVEFGTLELLSELNLGNNNLSGRVPFSSNFATKVGVKLRLGGNPGLCVDQELRSAAANLSGSLTQLKLCSKQFIIPQSALLQSGSIVLEVSHVLMFLAFLFFL